MGAASRGRRGRPRACFPQVLITALGIQLTGLSRSYGTKKPRGSIKGMIALPAPARPSSKSSRILVAMLMLVVVGVGSSNSAWAQEEARARYGQVKAKARAWFDALEVDPIALDALEPRVKGKKKLAEIVDAYDLFHRHAASSAEREAILARVRELCRVTATDAYHDMRGVSDEVFDESSMSYLRVVWLMKEFGLDTTYYRERFLLVRDRFDAHLEARGSWQRAMFARYYGDLGFELPKLLQEARMEGGVIAKRLPLAEYSTMTAYDLTHEIFVAFDYGLQSQQDRFDDTDLEYARAVIPLIMGVCVEKDSPDLLAEALSCATYLRWQEMPIHATAVEHLLEHQNETGTWGDYEQHRSRFGDSLDQHAYLHTTLVAMRALHEVFEQDWTAAASKTSP